jgi:integrase/recombinase XerD
MSSLRKEGKYIYIYFRDRSGRQYHQSLRTSSWTIAKKIQREIENRLALETFDLDKPNYSLGEVYSLYFHRIAGRKAETTLEIDRRFFKKLVNYFGDDEPADLGQEEAEDFIGKIFTETSPTTTNICIRHLKSIFNYLKSFNVVTENPFTDIPLYKVNHKEVRYFTSTEVATLIKESNGWLNDWIRFGVSSGLRLNEIKNIRSRDINWKTRTLMIRVKGGRPEHIPLNEHAVRVLEERLEKTKSDFLFDEPVYKETVSKRFKKLLDDLDIKPDLTFHNLRHTFASLLVQSGVSLQMVKELLNHHNISTTQIYAHLAPENLSKATSHIDQALRSE